jgi:phosphoglycolate phosphatase-like HAD superfamily hydrolase
MKQEIIYTLDFDGVICDSAVETGITGWKAAKQLWDDLATPLPSQQLIEQFRKIRPILETGYEAILLVRLLHDGETVETILNNFSELQQNVIKENKLDTASLKKLFGATRDNWINDDLNDWIEMNPLFSGVTEKLQDLGKQDFWYIITTKQEHFVKQILIANQIQLADERIFGLDRKLSKEAILTDLVKKHAPATLYFVEDRLPTLFNVIKNKELESVKLFFALWGYNTEQDKLDAEQQAIKSITLDDFLFRSNE